MGRRRGDSGRVSFGDLGLRRTWRSSWQSESLGAEMSDPITSHNRAAWDGMVRRQHHFTQPVRAGQLAAPLDAVDSLGWLCGSVAGKRVLCLAAGGGKYGVLFAAAGAEVTVVDISPAMLAIDRAVAAAQRLTVRTVEASMTDLGALPPNQFDIVAQPVSTCYVPDISAVYRAVARVVVVGGIYISQHKQPGSLQADSRPSPRGYELIEPYYRTGPLPPMSQCRHREAGTLEFLHRWSDLLGGLCRAGFVIEDVAEPLHVETGATVGSFEHRSLFLPPYVRIKARRVGSSTEHRGTASRLVGI